MPITIKCGVCGRSLTVADHLRGKRVRCPDCRETIAVEPAVADALQAEEPIETARPAPRRRLPDPDELIPPARRRPPRDELVPPPKEGIYRSVKKQPKVPSVVSRELQAGLVILGFLLVSGCLFRVILWFIFGGAFFGVPDFTQKVNTPQTDDEFTQVLKLTHDGDGFRRKDAYEALGRAAVAEHRRGEVTKALIRGLDDDNGFARGAAVQALPKWAGPESVADLRLLLDHNNGDVRKLGMEQLARLKDRDSVAPLALRLLQGDRQHASKALQDMGPMVEPVVLDYAKEQSAEVRVEVCRILKRVGTAQCVPTLQTLQNDRDQNVRVAAKDALLAVKKK